MVDRMFKLEGDDIDGIKAAITEYGPVFVGVKWDSQGVNKAKSGVIIKLSFQHFAL